MLQIKNICKEYKTGGLVQKALDNVSLNLRDNEFVSILGPSGSGKTTFLNIIGGLDRYDSGDLIINGISTKKYKDRDWDSYRNHTIGFVFQSYNLIPHQNILANVELALTISGVSKRKRKQRAIKALEQVGLGAQLHKKPNQLSGGQMQRVAIARALVNDPDILLADEPTGALDTETSVQVMELLKEVAKDRLVVMVTHNPELAEKYSTRIVNLRDGKIINDSDPYIVDENNLEKPKHKNMGKTSMSFLTSLSLSFNNLRTKKGRTFLTAFAGSIGIIGIAMILSLANGVNSYIKSVEEDTLSEYPLQIQSTGIDITSMLAGAGGETSDEEKVEEKKDIEVTKMLTNMFSTIGSNDLKSLMEYLESRDSDVYNYAKAIEYSYNVTPQIYSSDTENLRRVNPDSSFSRLGIGSTNSSNSMMSSMMSTNMFFKMPENTDLFMNQYDVKAGHWPENYNECVLVLTSSGKISDFMLYTLGLRDYEELDKMVEQFSAEEDVDVPENMGSYSYEDILNIKFKLINATDYYEYDEEYDVWTDKSENTKYMKKVVENGEDLKIVGVVQPKEGVAATMLQTGIYYPDSLADHIIVEAQESKILKEQLDNPKINVFTGKDFNAKEEDSDFDMDSLIEIDEKKLNSAFKFDESKIKLDFSDFGDIASNVSMPALDLDTIIKNLDFSLSSSEIQDLMNDILEGYKDYAKNHPESDVTQISKYLTEYLQSKEVSEEIQKQIQEAIIENGEPTLTEEQLKEIMNNILSGYSDYAKENNLPDISKFDEYLAEYLKSDEAKNTITNSLVKIMKSKNLDKQISNIMGTYMASSMNSLGKAMENQMASSMKDLGSSLADAISIDGEAFAGAFKMKMDEEELSELMASLMTKEQATYDSNLSKLGYADFKEPSSISIYPKDFEAKESIIKILDSYNSRMKEEGEEEKVISYTDIVGTLMSSVTVIVDVVSYVLVAFVGISLVVSSIMIGVITYISVLERKKEIGILRAIGASKKNISQVFNAETFIIGLLAGLIGIGVTLLLLIPTNMIIHNVAGSDIVSASMPVAAGIILVILSVILTLIGGIIPSKKAAKEDPVLALRSE